jgi:hypothetical protein
MTARETIEDVLAWANRQRLTNISAALRRALAKLDKERAQ